MAELTGQAIHAAFKEVQTLDADEPMAVYPWDKISERAQRAYNVLAEKLNAQYLAPLQGLVMQWQELLQAHDEVSVMSFIEIEDWHKEWEALKRRSAQLLEGEQKEG